MSEVPEQIAWLNSVSCCGKPDSSARTVREWDEAAADRAARAHRTPVRERLANLLLCPACLTPRLWPFPHWLTCRRRTTWRPT